MLLRWIVGVKPELQRILNRHNRQWKRFEKYFYMTLTIMLMGRYAFSNMWRSYHILTWVAIGDDDDATEGCKLAVWELVGWGELVAWLLGCGFDFEKKFVVVVFHPILIYVSAFWHVNRGMLIPCQIVCLSHRMLCSENGSPWGLWWSNLNICSCAATLLWTWWCGRLVSVSI